MLAEDRGVGLESIRKPAEQGLVDHEKYAGAADVDQRRAGNGAPAPATGAFLVNELATADEVHDEAEVLEHGLDRLMARTTPSWGSRSAIHR